MSGEAVWTTLLVEGFFRFQQGRSGEGHVGAFDQYWALEAGNAFGDAWK